MPITYREGDIRINPETKQVERLTPEGVWSAQALEQQVKGIQSEVQRLSKEATILDTGKIRDEVIPGMKNKLETYLQDKPLVEFNRSMVGNQIVPQTEKPQTTITTEERQALGIGETKEERQAKKLQLEVAGIDNQINTALSDLDSLRVNIKEQTAAQIAAIKRQFEVRRNEMKDLNTRVKASFEAMGIRGGGARYASEINLGIISSQEAAGIQRLQVLDAEEMALINQAQTAATNKDFQILQERINQVDKIRDDKATELRDLQKSIIARNQEVAKEKQQIEKQGAVMGLIGQGITDPQSIFSALQGKVGLDEIDKALDIILDSQANLGEEKLDTFTDAEGNRIISLRNKKTNEIRNIKVGTEGIKKPASYEEWEIAGGPQTGMTYFQFLTRKDKETGGDGMSSNLLTAIMMNPQLFNTLTPSAQTDLIPGLSQMGFEFPKKVSAEQEKNLMSAYSGVESLDIIENALDSDPDVFKKIAITPFGLGWQDIRVARKNAADVITRLRTGAALNVVEMKEYENYIPIWQDTPESAKGKINFLRRFYKLFTDNAGDTFPVIKKKAAKNLEQGEILVQDKKTGEMGAIKENEYNPNQYIKLTY